MGLLFVFLSEASYRASTAGEAKLAEMYGGRIERLEEKLHLHEISAGVREVRDLVTERRGELKAQEETPVKDAPVPEVHPPNIVFVDSELVKAKKVDYGIFADGWDEKYGYILGSDYVAVVAHYTNELDPPRKIGAVDGVVAQLLFIFDDGKKPVRVNRGAWMRIANLRVPFGPNDTERLIVAVVNAHGEPELQAVERESAYESNLKPLRDTRCTVQVRLVIEASGELIDRREFTLAMMVKPEFRIAFGEKKPPKSDPAVADT